MPVQVREGAFHVVQHLAAAGAPAVCRRRGCNTAAAGRPTGANAASVGVQGTVETLRTLGASRVPVAATRTALSRQCNPYGGCSLLEVRGARPERVPARQLLA